LSADGSVLLSAQGPDVVVWSVTDRAEVGRASGSRADVTAAAWSPDGRGFASAAADGTITVWDGTTRRPVRVLTGHGVAAHTVAYAPDGRALYSVGADGAVLAWDLSGVRGLGARLSADAAPADLVRVACASAGRELSRDEWARFLPGRGFEPVCPD
jgi:WD40 repeat protein